MAATYTLAPVPKWYIADLVGRPLGGGYLATFSSLDHTSIKLVYEDSAGAEPWPYVTIPNVGSLGILFDENGSQGPFYFQFDSSTPDDLYYLEVYDADGNLQWTIDGFSPANGGGGSIITTTNNLNNQIINNVFWRCFFPTTTPVAPGVFKLLAPSAHAGFANNAQNANGLYTGSDTVFLKNNNNATDTIQFAFFPLGVNTLNSDVTPLQYLNYTCSNAGIGGETQKCVQWPVCRSVQNLSNQNVVISFWARSTGITNLLTLYWFQFFGSGGTPSANLFTPIQIVTLSNTWQRYTITTSVPSVIGKTLGSCNNDALFLQFQYPLSALCNIDFVKPTIYLGNTAPLIDFQTYDVIDALINSPRTGKVIANFDASAEYGWIAMDDKTIGQVGSGATGYAGADVFPLYNLLYNNVLDTWAPVSGGRSGSAITDFTAGKVMTLPKALGRALSSAGSGAGLTPRVRGESAGSESASITLSVPNLPAHHHASPSGNFLTSNGGSGYGSGGQTIGQNGNITADTGSGTAFPVATVSPSTYMSFFIKL